MTDHCVCDEVFERAFLRLMKEGGGAQAVADRLGMTRAGIHKWRQIGIPPQRADEIERLYGIPRWEQNPKIFRNPLDEIVRWGAYIRSHGEHPVAPMAA
jgi:hypothetical protein